MRKATLEGWLKYQLIEGGKIVQDGEQHNLILNSGLDQVASYGIRPLATYAAVGTGSTAPAVAQTALAAQLARTAANGGVQDTLTQVSDGDFRYVCTREFVEAEAVGNLTEWGFSPTSNGNLYARELFRDGQGNPIVLTKSNAQKLRLIYTLEIRLTPVVLTAGAVNIAGLGNRTGHFVLQKDTDNRGKELSLFEQIAVGDVGVANPGQYNYRNAMALVSGAVGNPTYSNPVYPGVLAITGGTSAPAYVPGSFQRGGVTYTFDTPVGNGTISGVQIKFGNDYGNPIPLYTWAFDAGQEVVKTNQDKLILSGPSVSWGRA